MIVDFDRRGELINEIPFKEKYDLICSRITQQELKEIFNFIDSKVEGKEITVSSFIPGNDWSGTPLESIWSKAARKNEELSAKFFGLLVFIYFMNRDDTWGSGHYDIKGRDDLGRTYFKMKI